uniref:Serine/threonine-protein phosphatase n=1 Tax=Panagrolaimus sp. JU765 TaxID=591449 RepID=A0AC34QMB3_9BILA
MIKNFIYGALLKKHLTYTDEKIEYDTSELLRLIKDAKDLLMAESSLLEVKVPVIIIGDIHGQYLDLHRIFKMTGKSADKPGQNSRRFLFLGDYVDRGPQSLECIVCLLVHKLAFPRYFNMLRGNHESMAINRVYGFYQELRDRFSEEDSNVLWKAFNDLFSYLPLAALVHGRILCMHGGISPQLNSLDDIRRIKRPLEEPNSNHLACDLLWSDPMIDLSGYTVNVIRGVSYYFGENAVVDVCNKLGIDLIVRAHQMMMNGYGFFCKRRLLTVFSAPRYYPEKNNKGAVLKIDKNLKIGFILLSPVTQDTRGQSKFANDYTKREDDASYMVRAQPPDPASVESLTALAPSPDLGTFLKK